MKIEIPGTARHSCLMCGRCCRTSIISLTEAEAGRLATSKPPRPASLLVRKYRAARGDAFRIEPRPDGSCPFLVDGNLCSIHASEGEGQKPLACRLFPFQFVRTPSGVHATLRFNCPAVALGSGENIAAGRRGLENLAAELDHAAGIPSVGELVRFDGRRSLPFADLEALRDHALRLVSDASSDPAGRLAAADEFAFLVARSGVDSGSRFRFWQAMADGSRLRFRGGAWVPWPPNVLERMILRQAAFSICAISGQAVLRTGLGAALLRRAAAAARAALYSAGIGGMRSAMEGAGVSASLAAAATKANSLTGENAAGPLFRYVASRLESFAWLCERPAGSNATDAFNDLFMSAPFAVWIARVTAGGIAPSAADYAGAVMRMADAGSTPLVAQAMGSGLNGVFFRRRGAWMRAMAWACGAQEGGRIMLPGVGE